MYGAESCFNVELGQKCYLKDYTNTRSINLDYFLI